MRVLDILKIEEPQQGDTFDIEISESEMITTGIVDLVEDGIVIHADEYLFGLLANTGLLEDIRVPVKQKPRQGPLRPQTGGGAHRDKKKEQKQGKEKHKGKPLGEGSEHEVKQNLIKHIMDMDPNMELNYLEMATIEELAEILGKMSDSVGEASNQRDKRNPTRDHLRRYPVPQDQMARPVKKPEKKKPEQGVAEDAGQLVPGKFYVVGSEYSGSYGGNAKAVAGPFDDEGEAEIEKAEYSQGGREDAAVAQWTGKDWNFDYMMEGIDGSNDFYAFADLFSHPNEYTHPDPEEAVRLITAQGQNPKITASNIIKFAKSNPDELSNSAVANAVKSLMSQGIAEGFASPEQEAKVRARLRQLQDIDPDNMYKIVARQFGMSEEELRAALHDEGPVGEAEYQGRNVPLGKPMAGDVKKSKVYVKGPKGNVVKVNFGDKKMRIKKSNPNRRKSFRARHNCDNPGPRWKARYWSCRAW
jgi:hypothetical protein